MQFLSAFYLCLYPWIVCFCTTFCVPIEVLIFIVTSPATKNPDPNMDTTNQKKHENTSPRCFPKTPNNTSPRCWPGGKHIG
ncbi:hypothetical protein QBC37DRAFT_427894 [Rhypophila decipiens]|uniref:Uncharacterized protein n=1 Tax=Rhypophila decipiens TaxID=261697 RepID=A0AAN6Y3Z1_9PEZI|nr:hypothetical protein QBC37DRAFT_427894 [Rhypophila decipiens]